nr:MAG TPA: hypothetical protein [Caudoviricetes sp.]
MRSRLTALPVLTSPLAFRSCFPCCDYSIHLFCVFVY